MPTPHHSIFTRWMLFLTPNQQYQSTKGSQRHKTANEIMQQIKVKTNWSAIVYYCNDISVNTAHIKVKSSLIIFIHRKIRFVWQLLQMWMHLIFMFWRWQIHYFDRSTWHISSRISILNKTTNIHSLLPVLNSNRVTETLMLRGQMFLCAPLQDNSHINVPFIFSSQQQCSTLTTKSVTITEQQQSPLVNDR